MCDFGPVPSDVAAPGVMSGPLSVAPEMTKVRHVVILTPGKSFKGTCVVVPLSTKIPTVVERHHHCFVTGTYPFLTGNQDSWVKADMITTVSYERLDRVRVGTSYLSPSISVADFERVKECVRHALTL